MSASKDKNTGKWNCTFYYMDWTGKKVKKLKRGFRTRSETLDWEKHFLLEKASSLDMTFGDFECSDDRLNRLYLNTIWSQHSNMISIPTDCPQREKAGWTGDIAVYSKTALQNEDVNAFLENWLLSLTADQSEEGILPIISPYNHIYRETADNSGKLFPQKDMVGAAGWADAGVLVPWAMYQVSGNTDILAKQKSMPLPQRK